MKINPVEIETKADPGNPIFVLAVKILKTAGASEVYVFGSAAHGTIEAANDIDIAVSGLAPEKFISSFCAIDSILSKPFDLIDLDSDNPFTRYLKSENELLRIG